MERTVGRVGRMHLQGNGVAFGVGLVVDAGDADWIGDVPVDGQRGRVGAIRGGNDDDEGTIRCSAGKNSAGDKATATDAQTGGKIGGGERQRAVGGISSVDL